MQKAVTVHGFLKIGKEKHIDALQKSGIIYCNTVQFFRTLEEDEIGRKDYREGASSSIIVKSLSMLVNKDPHKEIKLEAIRGHLNFYNSEDMLTHLYCLYVVKSEHVTGKPFIDSKNLGFGDKALFITNTDKFMKRFKRGAEIAGIQYSYGFVNYYDEGQNHPRLTIYNKPNSFEYQSEFRFHIKNRSSAPIKFEIGSIEDISMKLEATSLTRLRLEPPVESDMQ